MDITKFDKNFAAATVEKDGKKRHAVFRGFARTLGMRRLRTHGRRRKSMENLPALRRGTGARNVASAFRRQPRLTGRIFAYLADSILKGE